MVKHERPGFKNAAQHTTYTTQWPLTYEHSALTRDGCAVYGIFIYRMYMYMYYLLLLLYVVFLYTNTTTFHRAQVLPPHKAGHDPMHLRQASREACAVYQTSVHCCSSAVGSISCHHRDTERIVHILVLCTCINAWFQRIIQS